MSDPDIEGAIKALKPPKEKDPPMAPSGELSEVINPIDLARALLTGKETPDTLFVSLSEKERAVALLEKENPQVLEALNEEADPEWRKKRFENTMIQNAESASGLLRKAMEGSELDPSLLKVALDLYKAGTTLAKHKGAETNKAAPVVVGSMSLEDKAKITRMVPRKEDGVYVPAPEHETPPSAETKKT